MSKPLGVLLGVLGLPVLIKGTAAERGVPDAAAEEAIKIITKGAKTSEEVYKVAKNPTKAVKKALKEKAEKDYEKWLNKQR